MDSQFELLERLKLLDQLGRLLPGGGRKAKQIREVVPIEQWLENPFYCGEDGLFLYDYWKEEITQFIRSGLSEIIIYGSLGGGKTVASSFILLRKIYELSCFEPIPYLFNLMANTVIFMIYFSISLTQAKRTGYGKIMRMADSIPYFQKYFPRDQRISSELQFRSIRVTYGSTIGHQIGLDLLCAILDEGDFYQDSASTRIMEEFSTAQDIYTSVANRRKLRFSTGGKDNGLSILISSPAYGTDFVERRMQQVVGKGTAYLIRMVGFELTPAKYRDAWFYVFPGTDEVDPMIVETVQDLETLAELTGEEIPEKIRAWSFIEMVEYLGAVYDIQKVPEDFRSAFEDDILKAIRDILGRSIRGVAGYLTVEQVTAQIDRHIAPCFSKSAISLSTRADNRIEEYFLSSGMAPKSVARYIHIDQSINTDKTGLACAYQSGTSLEVEVDPLITVEWMLTIIPPTAGEIPLLRIVEFIAWLSDHGYEIGRVTMDSFQSRASLQYLQDRGIPAAVFSVDRDDSAYVTLRNFSLRKRVTYADNSQYIREVSNLVWNRKRRKVDHKPGKSKDLSDSVAAAVHNAVMYGGCLPSVSSARDVMQEVAMQQLLKESEWEEL